MQKQLTLEQKIGQRLVGGFPSTEMSPEFVRAVKEYKIGNVILFRENVRDLAQLKQLCADIQALVMEETGVPAFITIDQEGGAITRLPENAVNVPGAMAIAATGNIENAYRAGLLTGQQLRSVGVNFDLAPVLDVNNNPDNPIIGVRSYGENPEEVAAYGVEMIRGLLDGKVLASAKHFPGHGDTNADSHVSLPCVDKDLATLEKMELLPFQKAIAAGVPAITTTHILFPQLEKKDVPATMSRAIMTDLLRKKMGFQGLIISDCMEMSAIKKYYGTVNGVAGAVQAGVDLVFVSHSAQLICEAADTLKAQVQAGTLSLQEMDESVARILEIKEKYALQETACAKFDSASAMQECDKMRRASLTEVQLPHTGHIVLGDNPLCLGCAAYNTGMIGNIVEEIRSNFCQLLAPMVHGTAMPTAVQPTDEKIEKILAVAQNHSSIIMHTYNGHLRSQQMKLLHALAKTGIPMAAVALRNPYDLRDLPPHVYALEAYEYTAPIVNAVADVLLGKAQALGKLPVTITARK